MERVVTRGEMVEGMGMPTIVQPPYSPELNPAERVFQEVRRCVEGRVYEMCGREDEAVDAYLNELESDPGRVRSLTAWKMDRTHDAKSSSTLCGLFSLKWYKFIV